MAWLALGAAVAAHLWLFNEYLRDFGLTHLPDNLLTWIFVVLWLFGLPLTLTGMWLLTRAVRIGGGRFQWRWWIGVLLSWDWFVGEVGFVLEALEEPYPKAAITLGPYADFGSWLGTAAIVPVLFLAWTQSWPHPASASSQT